MTQPTRSKTPARRHAFGFDHVMRNPSYRRVPDYDERATLTPISGRAAVEAVFSAPEA